MGRIQVKIPTQDSPISLELQFNGESLTATYNQSEKEKSVKARLLSRQNNQGLLEIDGQMIPYYTAQSNDKPSAVQVWILGNIYEMEKAQTGAKRAKGGQGNANSSGDLKSSMPGKVLEIKVAVDDKVSPDDTMIIMESMKMEMSMNAPFKGSVKEINVAEGDLVEMNTLLVRLEAETTDA